DGGDQDLIAPRSSRTRQSIYPPFQLLCRETQRIGRLIPSVFPTVSPRSVIDGATGRRWSGRTQTLCGLPPSMRRRAGWVANSLFFRVNQLAQKVLNVAKSALLVDAHQVLRTLVISFRLEPQPARIVTGLSGVVAAGLIPRVDRPFWPHR